MKTMTNQGLERSVMNLGKIRKDDFQFVLDMKDVKFPKDDKELDKIKNKIHFATKLMIYSPYLSDGRMGFHFMQGDFFFVCYSVWWPSYDEKPDEPLIYARDYIRVFRKEDSGVWEHWAGREFLTDPRLEIFRDMTKKDIDTLSYNRKKSSTCAVRTMMLLMKNISKINTVEVSEYTFIHDLLCKYDP